MQLLKLNQVITKTTLSKSSIYRLIRTSNFPAPKKLSQRAVAWLERDIDEWIEGREACCSLKTTNSISTLEAYLLNNSTQWEK